MISTSSSSLFASTAPHCSWCYRKKQAVHTLAVYESCKNRSEPSFHSCKICAEYATLEAQIQETKRVLDQQLDQQRKLREEMNNVHDPLAPNLPVEIVSHIFEYAVVVDWDTTVKTLHRSGLPALVKEQRGPLYLGAVCRAWRRIAWNTPRLWTVICQEIYPRKPIIASLMKEWLSRTGRNLPLSVMVTSRDDRGHEGYPKVAFDILNFYSHRWQKLAISGDSLATRFLVGNSQGAPILRKLSLNLSGSDNWSFRLMGVKPRPTCVSTEHLDVNQVDIEWGDVTSLTASFFDLHDFYKTLEHTPRLEKLCVDEIFSPRNSDWPPTMRQPTVSYPNIRTLALCKRLCSSSIFDTFQVPGLTSLSMEVASDWDARDCVTSLLQNSSPVLKELSINSCNDGSEDPDLVIGFLAEMPSLEALTIRNVHGDSLSRLFNIFGVTDGAHRGQFLPNLQSLTITFFDTHWDDLPLILGRTAAERKRPLKRLTATTSWFLTSGEIFLGHKLSKEVILRFLQLKEEGICLYLPGPVSRDDLLRLLDDGN